MDTSGDVPCKFHFKVVPPNDLSDHEHSRRQEPRGERNWRTSTDHRTVASTAGRNARGLPPHVTRESWRSSNRTPVASTARGNIPNPPSNNISDSLEDSTSEPFYPEPPKLVDSLSTDERSERTHKHHVESKEVSHSTQPKTVWRSRRVQKRILETQGISTRRTDDPPE